MFLFDDNKNLAVFSTTNVMKKKKLIVHVSHDEEGDWQFFAKEAPLSKNAMLIGLSQVLELDDTLLELENLPVGFRADRNTKEDPWRISKIIEEEEE